MHGLYQGLLPTGNLYGVNNATFNTHFAIGECTRTHIHASSLWKISIHSILVRELLLDSKSSSFLVQYIVCIACTHGSYSMAAIYVRIMSETEGLLLSDVT